MHAPMFVQHQPGSSLRRQSLLCDMTLGHGQRKPSWLLPTPCFLTITCIITIYDIELKNEDVVVQLWEQDLIDEMVIINRDRVDFKLTKDGKTFVKKSDNPDLAKMKEALKMYTMRSTDLKRQRSK